LEIFRTAVLLVNASRTSLISLQRSDPQQNLMTSDHWSEVIRFCWGSLLCKVD